MISRALFLSLLAASSCTTLAQVTTVLTNDPRVTYSGPGQSTSTGVAWGDPGLDPTTYNDHTCGTGLIATANMGAAATLLFTGISVAAYFLADQNAAGDIAVFLDNIVIGRIDTRASNASDHYYTCQQSAVSSDLLPYGTHNITVVKNAPTGFMFLQEFVINGQAVSSKSAPDIYAPSGTVIYLPSSTIGASSFARNNNSSSSGTVATTAYTESPSSPSTTSESLKSIMPEIIGAIAGMLVICVLATVGIIYYRRVYNSPRCKSNRDPSIYTTSFTQGNHSAMLT
ncbi:hypothetical protein FRB94_000490 [Tulasnella sp. JGI-2019a]|nr:hypothetical protein FRB93_010561 [Tulasnella sp. JGI-2019a]KAG9006655.1 hypothetical protein FRB94_000490 [Tulasnella sp. JGI-2019a]KAG9039032.1 hypothetical protein FRB95_012743 [Tulasnella sp. JGI-2019a]